MCIFGLLDKKALETIVLSAAHSIVDPLGNGHVSKPKRYVINGRTFAAVSAFGVTHGTIVEQRNFLVIATTIREHVVGWTAQGPDGNILEQTLAGFTVQIGEEKESPLLLLPEKP